MTGKACPRLKSNNFSSENARGSMRWCYCAGGCKDCSGARFITPIVAAMGRELLEGDYIQADETPVGVQMHDGRGKNRQAYLWQYSRPKGPVVFDFRLGREREGPKRFPWRFCWAPPKRRLRCL